jgi:hypothetical protein
MKKLNSKVKFLNLKNTKDAKQFSIKNVGKTHVSIFCLDDRSVIRTITLPKSYFLKVLSN